jgi:predicted dehydrogenase
MRVAVVGAGEFGRNHCRVVRESGRAELSAVVDTDPERAAAFGAPAFTDYREVIGRADVAVVAVPTTLHAEVACALLEAGLDVLVEKPIAHDVPAANRLVETAERHQRILQVGHLERFNPAVTALEQRVTLPLFFEVHRLSVFTPRSLDVDVVLDLMIHDLDIVLSLTGEEPREVRAAGISILSPKVDIANVRLEFSNGCIANLTASRVSTDKVRKLRLFQPRQYLSLDYTGQDVALFSAGENRRIGFEQVAVSKGEPLRLQWEAFLDAVETRRTPKTSGASARQTLRVALTILDKIKEHTELVSRALASGWKS